MVQRRAASPGFTLIELSIVLVIIGLLVGGVLAGRDLIGAAEVRATISQVEKFNTAANTFRERYGYLPGDIKDPEATSFGFAPRGNNNGSSIAQGDGNGIIEGYLGYGASSQAQCAGEAPMFWVDLSTAHLIEGTFNTADVSICPASTVSGAAFDNWFPQAKLGGGNYIMVGEQNGFVTPNENHFTIVAPISMAPQGNLISYSGLMVKQAYEIDKKIDDGFPTQGRVNGSGENNGSSNSSYASGGTTAALYPSQNGVGSSTTCFDNGNGADTNQHYSLEISNGSNRNCALMIQFQ